MRHLLPVTLVLLFVLATAAGATPSNHNIRAHKSTMQTMKETIGQSAKALAETRDWLSDFDREPSDWARDPNFRDSRSRAQDLLKSDLVLATLVDYGDALRDYDASTESKERVRKLESQLAGLAEEEASLAAFNVLFGQALDAMLIAVGDDLSDSASTRQTAGLDLQTRLLDAQHVEEKLLEPKG